MAAFNITGVARVELCAPLSDEAALAAEAIAIFNAINAARHKAGGTDQLDATVCQGHKALMRLYWSVNRGARVLGARSQ